LGSGKSWGEGQEVIKRRQRMKNQNKSEWALSSSGEKSNLWGRNGKSVDYGDYFCNARN
jgi:hypothetical protein